MRYPLKPLLDVRILREENASAELTAAKRRVTEALQAVEDRKRELVEYVEWRKVEEVRLFDEIKNHEVDSQGLEDHRTMVRNLRTKDAEYEKRVSEAEQDVVKARKAVEKSEKAYRLAVKEKQKIEAHRDLWTEDERKREALAEDAEMEEFTGSGGMAPADFAE